MFIINLILELGNISNYNTWQGTSLNITFNSTNSCSNYDLFHNGQDVDMEPIIETPVDGINRVIFDINITVDYDGVNNMSVLAVAPLVMSEFVIYAQGEDIT